ncbi:hypothetical protein OAK01_05275 [Candidatus Nitrosopelagicus sp.]|nr:hypothetical protein [Candidatus Nitrosopelagicus sp.]
MTDIIWGTVTKVTANNKFEINVTHRKEDNKVSYADSEIVIFTEIDIMSLPAESSLRTIQQIQDAINGKFIKCEVISRLDDNTLNCKVFHSGAGGY